MSGIGYLEAWLRGIGCVPLYNLMEDAATAEISRAQVWQWIRHGAKLADGRTVDLRSVQDALDEELAKLKAMAGDEAYTGPLRRCREMFPDLMAAPNFPELLTLPAYEKIVAEGA